MLKNLLFAGLTFFKFYAAAQSFVATYGFADVITTSGMLDPGTPPAVNGLTFVSFSSSGTSANPSASGRFSFTGWPTGGVDGMDDYSNFAGVLSPTVYYEVAITVHPGYTLSLGTLTFSVRRSGTGIRNYCVRSDLDNFTNNLAASTGTATRLSVIPGDVFFWNYDSVSTSSDQRGSQLNFGSAFTALTTSIRFRFYAWNAETSGGSFSIDNVSFTGSVTNSPVGLAELQEHEEVQLAPNPSADGTSILQSTGAVDRVEVLSVTGSSVWAAELRPGETRTMLNLSHLPGGMYFVKSYSGQRVAVKKLILTQK
jgi:hypothetical protein